MIIRLARLARMGWVMARHDALLPHEYRHRFPWPLRVLASVSRLFAFDRAGRPGERLARALEQLGPAQIKLGQFLAARPDVIGLQTAEDLSRLQDALAPAPEAKIRAALEASLAGSVESRFAEFGPPVAAASIAQVHKARAPGGRPLAVKIVRPGVERRLARDLDAFRLGARLAQRFAPPARRLEPVAFIETMAKSLVKELDMRVEGAANSEYRDIASGVAGVRIPEIDWDRTSAKVLSMEWIEGRKLTDPATLKGQDRPAIATAITRLFLHTALNHGYFHADMHAGNVLLDEQGRVVLVDFGIMGRIGPNERRYLAEILYAFIKKDFTRAARMHFEAGYVPAHQDEGEFAQALRAAGEPIWGKTADQVSMADVLIQLWEITDRFDMHLRPELVLLQKTMAQVEGLCRQIDPRHDLWGAARPEVEAFMRRELGPRAIAERALGEVRRAVKAAEDMPLLLKRLEEAAERPARPLLQLHHLLFAVFVLLAGFWLMGQAFFGD